MVAGFSGVLGIQNTNREFSAIGEEAFIIPSDTHVMSLFLIEEHEFNHWHGEFGLRYDKQSKHLNFKTLMTRHLAYLWVPLLIYLINGRYL